MSLLFNGRMTLTFNAHAIVSLYQRPENKEPRLLPAAVLWALRRQRSFPVISDYSIPFWWMNEAGRKGGSERRKEGKKARRKKGAEEGGREREGGAGFLNTEGKPCQRGGAVVWLPGKTGSCSDPEEECVNRGNGLLTRPRAKSLSRRALCLSASHYRQRGSSVYHVWTDYN